jgi:Domain of unknown function (DUF4386)
MTGWLARIGTACGALYVIIAVIATGGGGDQNAPSLGADGATIARYYAAHTYSQGVHVEALAILLQVFFVAALWGVLRRSEPTPAWLSAAALGAGMAAVAVKLSSFPAFFALVYHAQPLDPNLARALFEMNSFAFLVTWYLQAALLLAVMALSLAHRALPLWLGIPAGLIAIALLVAVQFAVANFVVVPELLWLLWVVVTSVYLTIWPPRVTVRAQLTGTAP